MTFDFPRPPEKTRCHQCGHEAAVAICPLCGTERPAYTALKRMTEERTPTPKQLVECRYYRQRCYCHGKGLCLDAA